MEIYIGLRMWVYSFDRRTRWVPLVCTKIATAEVSWFSLKRLSGGPLGRMEKAVLREFRGLKW